ncbi:unnamed protein product [Effrenium voratum]|uniref:Uncharacterized protein n=1 Tax=Effrenium voratum TaxID=2562239 RepID=A0AA36MRK3_9DINO|nr:unnamed protein product [Effrenium voratum]
MGCCGSAKHKEAEADTAAPGTETLSPEDEALRQKKQAKKMVKVFVKEMVRGRKLEAVLKTGKRKACACSVSRSLDALKVKLAGHSRTIALVDVAEIHAGTGLKRVDTPLDELCVTLILASQDAITFRFEDVEERDTFAACLMMFIQRAQGAELEDQGEGMLTEAEVAEAAGEEEHAEMSSV